MPPSARVWDRQRINSTRVPASGSQHITTNPRPPWVWGISILSAYAAGGSVIFWLIEMFGLTPGGPGQGMIFLPGTDVPDYLPGIIGGSLELAAAVQLFRLAKSAVILWGAVFLAALTMTVATLVALVPSHSPIEVTLDVAPSVAASAAAAAIVGYCWRLRRKGVLR